MHFYYLLLCIELVNGSFIVSVMKPRGTELVRSLCDLLRIIVQNFSSVWFVWRGKTAHHKLPEYDISRIYQ